MKKTAIKRASLDELNLRVCSIQNIMRDKKVKRDISLNLRLLTEMRQIVHELKKRGVYNNG